MAVQHWFLHADLDAFFASVEQMDHPEYRGKPLIVGGLPSDPRSVVSTASYEARKYGVHSAMPTKEAYKLCPHGIYIRGNHKRYSELSWQIMEIFRRFSPDVQQMSIDEAFIDLTGTERLFGPPEETALKIKEAVRNEIGLTVSIGLAQTKYFAKLSSDINKPDGFYFMKPGQETAYMTSIPIEKIWGIGKKTAGRIKDSGIKTTLQLYNTPLETLIFMYGNNTATFLYNILRGNADGMFDAESKSHSISNEKTFPVDIYDYYANETTLLELAHSVMFRLLRENLRSRTVVIKIRYDDFTTVSARQTYDTDIITLDSLFEKVRNLFSKKYERNRGVRLLGVGFDNVTNEPATFQQDLFDDGQKKKQAVEKAILKFESKYPDLPVQKARLINTKNKAILFFLLAGLFFSNKTPKLNAEAFKNFSGAGSLNTQEILPLPEEAPEHLFDLKLKDASVDFFSSGYWKAEAGTSINSGFGNEGFSGFGFGGLIFKQEVQIDFKLLINKKWFFETSFADEFNKNTITFGYQNSTNPDNFIKKAILSNRNIIYPEHYSSSVFGYNPHGGNNQSPGFYMDLMGSNWKSNFMFRYDLAKTNSAVFYGMNEVSDFKIPISDYIKNKFYYIPKKYLEKIESVFVQIPDSFQQGFYKDHSGRKYRKLEKGKDFLLYSEKDLNLLVLNKAPQAVTESINPYILVTLNTDEDALSLQTEMGTYDNKNSFLGKIQEQFSKNENTTLENFSFPLLETIEEKKAFVLQSDKFFSPFMCSAFYDIGIPSSNETSDFLVSNIYTEEPTQDFSLKLNSFLSSSSSITETHSYIVLSDNNLKSENSEDYLISSLFPLIRESGNLYLYKDSSKKQDLEIILRNYHAVPQLYINPSLNPQMVHVFINGIQDFSAHYNSQTGTITPSKNISDTDKILVTWQEDSEDFMDGAFSAATGFEINLTPELKLDTDLTVFLPLSPFSTFSTEANTKEGYISINQGTYFEKGNFKIQNNIGAAITNPDISGKKLVYEPKSGNTETFYHKSDAAKISKAYPDIPELTDAYFSAQSAIIPARDSEISGWRLPLEINFDSILENKKVFTSMNISLSDFSAGNIFNIALKPQFKNLTAENLNNIKVYLQLGLSSDENYSTEKNIPYWELTNGSNIITRLDLKKNEWQIVSFMLSEKDKALLSGNHDARLIFFEENHNSLTEGFLFAGPYESEGSSIQITTSDNLKAYSVFRQNESKNYWTKINFEPSIFPDTQHLIKLSDYFKASSFSDYNCINIIFKKSGLIPKSDENSSFVFSLKENDNLSMEITLKPELIEQLSDDTWHQLTFYINKYSTQNSDYIEIDGIKFKSEYYSAYLNKHSIPFKIDMSIYGYEKGEVGLERIYFSQTETHFKIQDNITATYKQQGDLLKIGSFDILKDTYFYGNAIYAGDVIQSDSIYNQNLSVYGDASMTILGIKTSAEIKASPLSKNSIQTAGHKIIFENSPVNALKFLSFQDIYRWTPEQKISEKSNAVSVNFSPYHFPLALILKDSQNTSKTGIKGNENISLSYNGNYLKPSIFVSFSENTNTKHSDFSDHNYFSQYSSLWENSIKFGNQAESRKEIFESKLLTTLPFISLSPSINFSISGNYSQRDSIPMADIETLNIEIPFNIEKNNFKFIWTKKAASSSEYIPGGNYCSDSVFLFQKQKNRNWFYITIPFYDLGDKSLPGKLLEDNNSFDKVLNSEYSFKWNRSLFNTIKDFYIPNSISFSAGRTIQSSLSNTDTMSYQLEINGQALNMFGTEGALKLFNWYEDDEFFSSGKLVLSHPFDEISFITADISLYGQVLFYIDTFSSLKAAADWTGNFSPVEDFLFNAKGSILWTTKGNSSPLEYITSLFTNNQTEKEENKSSITRKEILNMEFGKTTEGNFHKIDFEHRCDVKFQKYYTIYGSADLSYYYKLQNHNIALSLNLGAQMSF